MRRYNSPGVSYLLSSQPLLVCSGWSSKLDCTTPPYHSSFYAVHSSSFCTTHPFSVCTPHRFPLRASPPPPFVQSTPPLTQVTPDPIVDPTLGCSAHASPSVQPLGDDGDHATTAPSHHEMPPHEVRCDPSGRVIIQPLSKG